MSYSSLIKSELTGALPTEKCCRRAILCGMLAARGEISDKLINLTVDGDDVLAAVCGLVRECYGASAEHFRKPRTKERYIVSFRSQSALNFVSDIVKNHAIDISGICKCSMCKTYFTQGIFLACGKISDPEKCFCLELTPVCTETIRDFTAKFSILFDVSERFGQAYLYTKNGNLIADYFALIGDNSTTFSVLNSKIEKQFRSETNRVVNCEANNIRRSVGVAVRHTRIIERLISENRLSNLPEELIVTAKLRTQHPDLSLQQLSKLFVPPITKSGLSHRLAKIAEFADEILTDDGKNGKSNN